jgi:hypothetical protein
MGVSPVAILCNGPSLEDHANAGHLKAIPCETIGINRSWELMASSYHVMIDPLQWEMYERVTGQSISTLHNLYTGMIGPESANCIEILDSVEPRFSFYPMELGAWLCGAVTWVALQLAVHWKKSPICFFGLDLKPRGAKGKFWGGTFPHVAECRQRELFGYAAGLLGHSGIELINVVMKDEDTKCHAFPKRKFEDVFRMGGIEE